MAGHGPPPKDPEHRARRNRVATAGVIDAAPAKMPALGRFRPVIDPDATDEKRISWHPETKRWWRTIWTSAIAERWIDAHVPGLRALAVLVDAYWRAPDPVIAKQIHAEIRLAGREFGLTPFAARSLNWEFRRPVQPEEKTTPIEPGADPRKILTMDRRRTAAG